MGEGRGAEGGGRRGGWGRGARRGDGEGVSDERGARERELGEGMGQRGVWDRVCGQEGATLDE